MHPVACLPIKHSRQTTFSTEHTPSSQYRSKKEAHKKYITGANKDTTENIKIYTITKKVLKVIRKITSEDVTTRHSNKIQQGNYKHRQLTEETPMFLTSTTRHIKNEDTFNNIISSSWKILNTFLYTFYIYLTMAFAFNNLIILLSCEF
jgi:hypothetical protein